LLGGVGLSVAWADRFVRGVEVVKTAIVTGATSGIGRAAAIALGRAGWNIMVTGRDESRGRAVVASLDGGGDFLAVDLSEPGSPERLVDRTVERWGRLDLLVNNAGIYARGTVADVAEEDYDSLMNTNLRAAVLLAGAAVRAMRPGEGGVIVNVSSEAGIVAVPQQVAYNVSKAGLVMLTKSIAVDHAKDGIRAVTVCPGTTRTPLVEEAIAGAPDPAEHERVLASSRPANRLGKPEEIASAIVYAASEEASYLSGSEIVVDGGYTAA
jgi:NAD(P)-dependent dehydrogenase (short-subunit alcohol dehydrogenase family)